MSHASAIVNYSRQRWVSRFKCSGKEIELGKNWLLMASAKTAHIFRNIIQRRIFIFGSMEFIAKNMISEIVIVEC